MISTYVYKCLASNVTHYSYFGPFRSFTSNVGINVAFLNSYGKLTDIGSWYLGFNATGVKPDNVTVTPTHASTNQTAAPTYTVPALATELSGAKSLALPSLPVLLGLAMIAIGL